MIRVLLSGLLMTGSFTPRAAATTAIAHQLHLGPAHQSVLEEASKTGGDMTDESQAHSAEPLGLPEPAEGAVHKFDLSSGSDSITLDHLGPMVVNKDGSLSRIANWDKMAEIERKNTLRIVGKRNQDRLAALKLRSEGDDKSEL